MCFKGRKVKLQANSGAPGRPPSRLRRFGAQGLEPATVARRSACTVSLTDAEISQDLTDGRRARRQHAACGAGAVHEDLQGPGGGDIQFQVFEGSEHEWVAKPDPQTDKAREMVEAFIARQLKR